MLIQSYNHACGVIRVSCLIFSAHGMKLVFKEAFYRKLPVLIGTYPVHLYTTRAVFLVEDEVNPFLWIFLFSLLTF